MPVCFPLGCREATMALDVVKGGLRRNRKSLGTEPPSALSLFGSPGTEGMCQL